MMIAILILLPLFGGLLSGVLGKKKSGTGEVITLAVLVLELIASLALLGGEQSVGMGRLCGMGLSFDSNGMSTLLCLLAAILWLVSGLVSREQLAEDRMHWRYDLFLLLTLAAIQGVFLSADLYTTLVFFEVMSFTSYVLVLHNGDEKARRASDSYLAYAVIGGLVSLMGLFLLYTLLHTLRLEELPDAVAAYSGSKSLLFAAGVLSLTTFAAKVCMWPLHTWLPGSYTEAPAPATALLSGIITKAGVFGIFGLTAKLFLHNAQWGNLVLLFGVATMLWGGFMALCQTNFKTTLAYSSMSQIGFILVGTGMQALLGEENGMAVWGSVLHLTNHAWIKLILFLVAGLIFYTTGKLELADIQGFGRKKPALMFLFLMPALGVMGVPVWNGYISKTLIHESIVEYIHELTHAGEAAGLYQCIEWLFLIAGGMTVAYMTKLFVCVFVEENRNTKVQKEYDAMPVKVSKPVLGVLLACAGACPVLGLTPHITMEGMARFTQAFFACEGVEETVHYFALANLKGAVISLTIGAILYFGFVRVFVRKGSGKWASDYKNPWPAKLSLEEGVYRPLLLTVLPFVGAVCARFAGSLFEWFIALCNKILFFKATPTVTPGEDEAFANYDPAPKGRRGARGTLAFGLTLFALGYLITMIYLLVRNCLL